MKGKRTSVLQNVEQNLWEGKTEPSSISSAFVAGRKAEVEELQMLYLSNFTVPRMGELLRCGRWWRKIREKCIARLKVLI